MVPLTHISTEGSPGIPISDTAQLLGWQQPIWSTVEYSEWSRKTETLELQTQLLHEATQVTSTKEENNIEDVH